MKKIYMILIFLTVGIVQFLNAEPQLNGLFYGDGDSSEYYFLATALLNPNNAAEGNNSTDPNAAGARGRIYYYMGAQYLYIAIVVDVSVNDNVIIRKSVPSDVAYQESVGWSHNPTHTGKTLEKSDHIELSLNSGTQNWTWFQDLLYDFDGNLSSIEEDWLSDYSGTDGSGTPPSGIESMSSSAWNLNNTFDVTVGDNSNISNYDKWRSPVQTGSEALPPGYPTHDSVNNWEWPLVYEMRIPISSLNNNQLTVEVLSAHNSPPKDIYPDIPFEPVDLLDFGDAPDSYKTLSATLGAAHWLLPNGIYLGTKVDAEFDGAPSNNSTGDDLIDGTDDEDGVQFLNSWIPGSTANLSVTASGTGNLSAWADFNNDGDWDDTGEQIFADQVLANGINNLQVAVPASAVYGMVNTRFRYTTDSAITSFGIAFDGEVEDYQVEVIEQLASLGNYVWNDITQDGIQDGFEPPISQIVVNLYDYNSGNPTFKATTTTDTNGLYLFTGLEAGQYFVEFIKNSWDISPKDTTNDALDSDANPADGKTGVYTLAAGEENLTVDCGLYSSDPLPVTLSTFTAAYNYGLSRLQWTTQSESNNALWNVYRSVSQNSGQSVQVNYESLPGSGTTSEPTSYNFYDDNLTEYIQAENMVNPTIYYWIESVDNSGNSELHGSVSFTVINMEESDDSPEIPDVYGLNQNYPNPFNPDTSISFNLAKDAKASLVVYNVKGEKVKTLFKDKECNKNRNYTEHWDGKNSRGNTVSSGIYLAVLKTDKEWFTKKMILQK